ncbi:MAG: hypothetical protein KIT76_15435 [Pseudolabrys sp.]|nr:hypothetical protein [Pseudolabrys sp.]
MPAIQVKRHTLPPAGVDVVEITISETYEVDGVGKDTVLLKGELEAHRTVPLVGHGKSTADWETATVAAQFTNLSLTGESKVFGPVRVTLDRSVPSFGVVTAGKCAASIAMRVAMPQHGLLLHSAEPVQLQSTVDTVPPIGDEKTASVAPVKLVDAQSKRAVGTLHKAVVAWRDLMVQKALVQQ